MSDVTPIRDPKTDSVLTPQNAVLALIDHQLSNMRAWPPSGKAKDWGRPEANRLRAIMREYFGKLKTLKGKRG